MLQKNQLFFQASIFFGRNFEMEMDLAEKIVETVQLLLNTDPALTQNQEIRKIQQDKRYKKHLAKANKHKLFAQNGEQNAKFIH